MAGRIFFGMLPRQSSISIPSGLNLWGRLGRCSYCTAQKTLRVQETRVEMSQVECTKHNKTVPTYEQFKKDPKLQEEFAKMFENYANDPVHQKEETEAASLGYRLFQKR